MVLGTAIGPALTGALIDRGISFPMQGYGIAIYFVAASLAAGLGAGRAARRVAPVPAA
jgi:cyanate permease